MVSQSSSINNRPETTYCCSTNFPNCHAVTKAAGFIVKMGLEKITQSVSFLLKKSFFSVGIFWNWMVKPICQCTLDVFLSLLGGVISKNRDANALGRLALQASYEEEPPNFK